MRGGILGNTNIPTAISATGVWSLSDLYDYKLGNTWPSLSDPQPLWSNVVSLFKFNNNLTDSKGNVTLTAAGETTSSATQSKFGGYSLFVGNTQTNGNYAGVDGTTSGFLSGTGDFTIEMFIYQTVNGPGNTELFQWNTSMIFGTSQGTSSPKLFLFNGSAYNMSVEYALNTWHHVGMMRKSNVSYWLLNGTVTQFIASDNVNINSLSSPRIGASTYANESFRGYIDSFRYANQAFYPTTGYNVPTQEFPTS